MYGIWVYVNVSADNNNRIKYYAWDASGCISDIPGHIQKNMKVTWMSLWRSLRTCVGWSRRGVGAIGAVCAVRRVESKVVGLGVIWHGVCRAAVILVRAELAKWRAGAVTRLLAVIVAAVRRRGHWQRRGLLRFVQAVVIAWGNLVWMHIGVQVLKDPGHLRIGAEQPPNLCAKKKKKSQNCQTAGWKHDSSLGTDDDTFS